VGWLWCVEREGVVGSMEGGWVAGGWLGVRGRRRGWWGCGVGERVLGRLVVVAVLVAGLSFSWLVAVGGVACRVPCAWVLCLSWCVVLWISSDRSGF
jgi:hypothetical protein